MMATTSEAVPILIISCDKYADLWGPFFHIFKKRWPDCPFPLFLGSNHLICTEPEITSITIGEDKSWASGVRKMLEKLDSSHVIIFLEDFFIEQQVDTTAVKRLVEISLSEGVDCIRFAPLPAPTPLPLRQIPGYPEFGLVEPGAPYRVSAQAAVWKIDSLRELLIPGANAWEFEHVGTTLSELLPLRFWGPFKPFISYDHVIEKGKWKPYGIRICVEAGVNIDLDIRPEFSTEELAVHLSGGGVDQVLHFEMEKALSAFQQGKRISGLRHIVKHLAGFPFDLKSWGILFFGLLGPVPIQWLRRTHLFFKITRIRSRENKVV